MELHENFKTRLAERLDAIQNRGAGTIGAMLNFRLVDCDPRQGQCTLLCHTQNWMRNMAGTLHGGMCATVVDQAMGFVSYCATPGDGIAPTIDLQVSYHRPLIPNRDILVRVNVVSVTKSLLRLTAEACQADSPDRVCLTSHATYFYKPLPHES